MFSMSLPGARGRSSALAALASAALLVPTAMNAAERSSETAVSLQHGPILHRLTRLEYNNSLRDLFGLELPYVNELPADGIVAGFDNNSSALALPPILLENYLRVSRKVVEQVIGLQDVSEVTEQFRATGNRSTWNAGMPLGTRGGVRVEHFFPRDGEYELRALLDLGQALDPMTGARYFVVGARSEGVRLFRTRVRVSAGTHTFVAAFPDDYAHPEGSVPSITGVGGTLGGPLDPRGSAFRPTLQFWLDGKVIRIFEVGAPTPGEAALAAQPGPPTLAEAEIAGPLRASNAADTEARRKLFVCEPTSRSAQERCAHTILGSIARRAYRRDLTPADMEPILEAFGRKRLTAGFPEAIGAGLRYILMSPDFLFRIETSTPQLASEEPARVSGTEFATRLSYFLWSSLPDEALLNEAKHGRLFDARTLEREVGRMLADPRAQSLVDSFAVQWLGLRDFASKSPDPRAYPDFDDSLRLDLERQTRLFVRAIFRENRSILDILSSDFTFLNERLAKLYGIEGVSGPAFRRVNLNPDESGRRGGILGQGSVMLVTSHAASTSPILRGNWILTHLLNAPPPNPPASVPPLDTAPAADGRPLTTREQIERHRTNPVCSSCHARMDPYGFSLENFDVLGRWRTQENGSPIDASTTLPGGQAFSGPDGLKKTLLANADGFATATVTQLLTYATGRQLEKADKAAVRRIVNATKPAYRFQDIVTAIAASAPLQARQTGHAAATLSTTEPTLGARQ